ncbi:MAG: T9SS type A sorting domain-containing protein [candidate division Zixibacteria bacterium]|nr:T9SS type A sorting domain-containing protein [candidate division Zixibacteria bacterium]
MFEDYNSELSIIRYHLGGVDPYYNYNPTEAWDRLEYYPPDVDPYVPHGFIDGTDGQYHYNNWRRMFEDRQSEDSPLLMGILGDYNSENREGHLTISIEASAPVGLNTRLFCALIENDLVHQNETYLQVMRDMIPDASGEAFMINVGETLEFERDFVVDGVIEEENCDIVVFVQDFTTREIYQCTREPLIGITDVDEEQGNIPIAIDLMQNSPNPFNATTKISFDLISNSRTTLEVYNLAGQLIQTLVDGNLSAGHHNINWDASTYSSGIYFYQLTTNDKQLTKRMTLLK